MKSRFVLMLSLTFLTPDHYAQNLITIGTQIGGGTVYFIDNHTTPIRGLIAASQDVIIGAHIWGDYHNTVTTSIDLFTGEENTYHMLQQVGTSEAAFQATTLNPPVECDPDVIVCTEWHLPSLSELVLLWTNRSLAGLTNIKSTYYWSSSQSALRTSSAGFMSFAYGSVSYTGKTFENGHVYPIRSFTFVE